MKALSAGLEKEPHGLETPAGARNSKNARENT